MSLETDLSDLGRTLLAGTTAFQALVGVTTAADALPAAVELDDATPSGAHGVIEVAEVLELERVGAETFQGIAELTWGLYLPPDEAQTDDTARLRVVRTAVAGLRVELCARSDVMGWKASVPQRLDDGDALPGWYAARITIRLLVTA